jgi:hypothetical protein
MPNLPAEEERCVHCGRAAGARAGDAKAVAALQRRHPRVTCGEPTTDGWPCSAGAGSTQSDAIWMVWTSSSDFAQDR